MKTVTAWAYLGFDGHPDRVTFEVREHEDGTGKAVGKLQIPRTTFEEIGSPNRISLAIVPAPKEE